MYLDDELSQEKKTALRFWATWALNMQSRFLFVAKAKSAVKYELKNNGERLKQRWEERKTLKAKTFCRSLEWFLFDSPNTSWILWIQMNLKVNFFNFICRTRDHRFIIYVLLLWNVSFTKENFYKCSFLLSSIDTNIIKTEDLYFCL